MADPWALYVGTRDRLIESFRSLDAGQDAQRVPFAPDWTIADVARHVCGINADIASGRLERLGTDERTAHQVSVRAGRTLDAICDEWIGHEEAMRNAIESDGFLGQRLAADLIVHLHDIQHALGQPVDRDDEATVDAARTYGSIVPGLLLERCEIGVHIELADGSRFGPPEGSDASLQLRATPWDFLRSVTGRRSHREVTALGWVGDPTSVLDFISPYGPLRSDDAGF